MPGTLPLRLCAAWETGRMRLVVAGSPAAAVPTLRALAASDHEIAAVLTRPPTPQGRKRVLTPTPVAQVAAELGLPVIEASRVDAEVTARIAALDVDLGVIVAYGALLRRPVYAAEPFTIDPEATSGEVLAAMAETGADVVVRVVDALAAGTATATEQVGSPTTAPKLTLEDGRTDFAAPASVVHARLRGVTPEPGAFAHLGETRVKLLRAHRLATHDGHPGGTGDSAPDLAPGALRLVDGALLVGTADEPLVLTEVQPAGKKAMDAAAWARGLGPLDGKVLA